MIVDVHTHVWKKEHQSKELFEEGRRIHNGVDLPVPSLEDHFVAMEPVDRAIVIAFHSAHLGFHVPNDYVHDYVSQHPDKLIGFMSIDASLVDAVAEMERAYYKLGLKGIKMSTTYQNIDPLDFRLTPIYRFAEDKGLPIMLHSATTPYRRAPLRYANPMLFEEVALRYPKLILIVPHLGHPWGEDAIALIRKQPNVYGDISALVYRPWQLYNFMVMAHEWGVMPKLLFGTDYPIATPQETLKGLRNVNNMVEGTKLPKVPTEEIEGLIHRDALNLLHLE